MLLIYAPCCNQLVTVSRDSLIGASCDCGNSIGKPAPDGELKLLGEALKVTIPDSQLNDCVNNNGGIIRGQIYSKTAI